MAHVSNRLEHPHCAACESAPCLVRVGKIWICIGCRRWVDALPN